MSRASVLIVDDLRSPTWRKVKAWAEFELVILRKTIESDVSPEKTQKLRGQIRSLVLLLALEVSPALALEEIDDPD